MDFTLPAGGFAASCPDIPSDFLLDAYDYPLPEERIAQYPPAERGASRLLVLDRTGPCPGALTDTTFSCLPALLPQGALLVANNSRVAPARLLGMRPSGGKAELLLLTPPPLLAQSAEQLAPGWFAGQAEVLLKPGKNIRVGDTLTFGPHIRAEVLEKRDFGKHTARLVWEGDLPARLDEAGRIPLPPYIKRGQEPGDLSRYQTLHSRPDKAGSVAAPTAGLHFTEDMRARLAKAGFGWAEVTLHVGYGTFSPVRENDIRTHAMHAEYVEVPPASAAMVAAAKREGRPVIAVGTTSARTLEGAAMACGGQWPENGWQGWIDIFMYPGFSFRVLDGLVTNFHLPRSSLLMLVAALAGRKNVLDAYTFAVREKYRFFSYGDAMLVR